MTACRAATSAEWLTAIALADTLGQPDARGRRAEGREATVLGVAIAFLAFLIWSNPGDEAVDPIA